MAARSAVPWKRVGSGWVLAENWPGQFASEGQPKAAAATLYLIDPAGGRYRLYRWAASKNPPFLIDWSGDKTRALLEVGSRLEQVVLATGKVGHLALAGQANVIGYTRPDGLNLLGWRQAGTGNRVRLARYGLTGRLVKVLATGADYGSAVYSAAGTTLAVSGSRGLELVSNLGGVIRKLAVPRASAAGCGPARWWTARTILASCVATGLITPRLWLVPANGRRPTALTPQRGRRSRDLGDLDAWRLPSGLYVQAAGPCGTLQIFRQAANGSIKQVSVPHTTGNDAILTARGSRLLLRAQTGCPGSESLLWFNPGTGHEQWLIRTPATIAGVIGAVPYGRPANG